MSQTTADDRLIVAMDVPDALAGLKLAEQLGDAVSFYKIGLGMLTGGGLALANEMKQELGKRIFLDMKLFDIGITVEKAVRVAGAIRSRFSDHPRRPLCGQGRERGRRGQGPQDPGRNHPHLAGPR